MLAAAWQFGGVDRGEPGRPLVALVAVQQRVIRELPFGGATVNDVVIHLANNHMGFGGFAQSGIGAYHGKVGFDCFTHYKSTMKKTPLVEIPIRTAPYAGKLPLLKLFMH